jgi:hypothetical protein
MYSFERSLDANAERSTDEVDALLRRFFRAQMPSPWPPLKPSTQAGAVHPWSRPGRWLHLRSRFALAATLALLGLGSFFLVDLLPSQPLPANEELREYFSTPRYEQQILAGQKAREMGVRLDDQGIILDEDGTAALKVTAQPSR